jgi:hypothetical protein
VTRATVALTSEGALTQPSPWRTPSHQPLRVHSVEKTLFAAARRFFEVRSSLCASPKYLQEIGKPAHPRDLVSAAFVIYPLQKSVVVTNGKRTSRFR